MPRGRGLGRRLHERLAVAPLEVHDAAQLHGRLAGHGLQFEARAALARGGAVADLDPTRARAVGQVHPLVCGELMYCRRKLMYILS